MSGVLGFWGLNKMLRRKEMCDDQKYLIILSMSLKFIGSSKEKAYPTATC